MHFPGTWCSVFFFLQALGPRPSSQDAGSVAISPRDALATELVQVLLYSAWMMMGVWGALPRAGAMGALLWLYVPHHELCHCADGQDGPPTLLCLAY